MSRFALVQSDTVTTVVESASIPTVDLGGQWVACAANVGPGWTYTGSVFVAPVPAAVRSLTPRDFWRRFTAAERENLEEKFLTGTQAVKNKVGAFRTYILTGGNVELDDDYIIASVAVMETVGIIGSGRAAVILS
jgi:hypothetical protein